MNSQAWQRVHSFEVIWMRITWSLITRIIVHQRNPWQEWIHRFLWCNMIRVSLITDPDSDTPKELNFNLYISSVHQQRIDNTFFFLNLTGVMTGEEWNYVITDLVEDFSSSFKSAPKGTGKWEIFTSGESFFKSWVIARISFHRIREKASHCKRWEGSTVRPLQQDPTHGISRKLHERKMGSVL